MTNAMISSFPKPSHSFFGKLAPSGLGRRSLPTARGPRIPLHPATRGWAGGGALLVDCLWISNQASPAGERLKVEVNLVLLWASICRKHVALCSVFCSKESPLAFFCLCQQQNVLSLQNSLRAENGLGTGGRNPVTVRAFGQETLE